MIRVKDNGIGIAPEMLPRIFDLFVQGKRSADRAEGGLGLGLDAREEPGRRSTAAPSSALSEGLGPRQRVHHPAAAAAAPAIPSMPGAASPERPPRPNVDARAGPRRRRQRGRRRAHWPRCCARSATRCRSPTTRSRRSRSSREFQPEVAVLDIGLPVMDGYELARAPARDARRPPVPADRAHRLRPGPRPRAQRRGRLRRAPRQARRHGHARRRVRRAGGKLALAQRAGGTQVRPAARSTDGASGSVAWMASASTCGICDANTALIESMKRLA